jgi:hypothetical protein
VSTPLDTDRVRAVVSACDGVVRVHGRGPNGVSADDDELEVHVVARYGEVLPALGARVDEALTPLLGGRTLRFVVDDLADDDDTGDDAALTAGTEPVAALPGPEPVAALPAADEHPALPPGQNTRVRP